MATTNEMTPGLSTEEYVALVTSVTPAPVTRDCRCGCGQQTQATWFPGHDAFMLANPRCLRCRTKRIPTDRRHLAFCTIKCAAEWALEFAPKEGTDMEWSVSSQRWVGDRIVS